MSSSSLNSHMMQVWWIRNHAVIWKIKLQTKYIVFLKSFVLSVNTTCNQSEKQSMSHKQTSINNNKKQTKKTGAGTLANGLLLLQLKTCQFKVLLANLKRLFCAIRNSCEWERYQTRLTGNNFHELKGWPGYRLECSSLWNTSFLKGPLRLHWYINSSEKWHTILCLRHAKLAPWYTLEFQIIQE